MTFVQVRASVVIGFVIVLALVVTAGPASAAPIACGDTLGPGGVFALTADVGQCTGPGPAITLIGPVRLDLRGFDITCTSPAVVGLDINGAGVVVRSTIAGTEAPAEMTVAVES